MADKIEGLIQLNDLAPELQALIAQPGPVTNVVDNLTSTSTTDALSANMGNTLRLKDASIEQSVNTLSNKVATTGAIGMVKPDGITITVLPDGTISSTGGSSELVPTSQSIDTSDSYVAGINSMAINMSAAISIFSVNNTNKTFAHLDEKLFAAGNTVHLFMPNKTIAPIVATVSSVSVASGISTVTISTSSDITGRTVATKVNTGTANVGQIAFGDNVAATGDRSFAVGRDCFAMGKSSIALGYSSKSDGEGSVALNGGFANAHYAVSMGTGCKSTGRNGTSSGLNTNAAGTASLSANYYTNAGVAGSTALGRYNKLMSGSATSFTSNSDDAFVIGNGSGESTRSNAFRVTFAGAVFGLSAYNTSGADYAEYFEWLDGNVEDADRRGMFVTIKEGKIALAKTGDEIIGIVSSNPSVVGDSYEDDWSKKYLTNVWGDIIEEKCKIDVYDPFEPTKKEFGYRPMINPEFDPGKIYIPRSQRKEWDIVGLVGKLIVRHDGTAEAGKKLSTNDEGIGTISADGYFVLEVIDEQHAKVLVK